MNLDDNELENLKNKYKIHSQPKENENENRTIQSSNFFLKLLNKSNNSFKYIIIFLSYIIVLFLLFFIADKWVIPSIVHDRDTVIVPDIEGKDLKDASKVLNSNNLYYEIVSEQYSAKPEGIILKQIPEPKKEVKSKRPIFITISKGKETIQIPNLIGISVRQARVLIYNNGLNIGDIQYRYSDNYPKDSVISQSIAQGRELIYGDTINLVVSKGPEYQIYVPKLAGLALDGIENYIVNQGFKLGNVEFVESDTFVAGTIISQQPQSNTLAMPGEYINIVVAK